MCCAHSAVAVELRSSQQRPRGLVHVARAFFQIFRVMREGEKLPRDGDENTKMWNNKIISLADDSSHSSAGCQIPHFARSFLSVFPFSRAFRQSRRSRAFSVGLSL